MSHLISKLRRDELAAQHARLVEEALQETGGSLRLAGHRSGAGDPARLRGIPAIGRGVGGAIPGTHPEHVVMGRR